MTKSSDTVATPKGVSDHGFVIDKLDRDIMHRKMDAEILKMMDEGAKIRAETSRINSELRVHPWLPLFSVALGSGGFSAIVASIIVSLFTSIHH